jgi:hypothetical protein
MQRKKKEVPMFDEIKYITRIECQGNPIPWGQGPRYRKRRGGEKNKSTP